MGLMLKCKVFLSSFFPPGLGQTAQLIAIQSNVNQVSKGIGKAQYESFKTPEEVM